MLRSADILRIPPYLFTLDACGTADRTCGLLETPLSPKQKPQREWRHPQPHGHDSLKLPPDHISTNDVDYAILEL